MAKITAQFFIENNQRIPFPQFLRDERKSRGCSWTELDKICGVNRINSYVLAESKGEPNRPPHAKFLQIIHALGYSENDFKVDIKIQPGRGAALSKEEYEEKLRMLGERILRITQDNLKRGTNPQKLSVPVIKEVCGNSFYIKYAKGFTNRQKLHQGLLALDPRFLSIEIQHQVQRRTSIRNLEDFEKDIIMTSLLNYTVGTQLSERLPRRTIQHVLNELNTELKKRGVPTRTYASVNWYIQRMWRDYHKTYTFRRGSPSTSTEITDRIFVELTEEIADRQRRTPDTTLIADVLVEKDVDNRKRDLYRTYSDEGHKNLVVFLMEPDNYSEYISKDVSLFKIDYPEGEVDEVLREEYKEKMALLKARQEEFSDEADVIDFIDSWLRCDMIFRRKGGGFVVVEVKQRAVNRPNGFKNATKACQQLAAYTAVILDNILRHNVDNINATEYRPIKESVEGYLVAYEMDTSVENHLNRAGNKRPVKIPKQIVDTYITELHRRRQSEQTSISPTLRNELSHLIKST